MAINFLRGVSIKHRQNLFYQQFRMICHARRTYSCPQKAVEFDYGAEGGTRTHTSLSAPEILSLLRLPFRHLGKVICVFRHLEAPGGIEPPHRGFADRCVTSSPRRPYVVCRKESPARVRICAHSGLRPLNKSFLHRFCSFHHGADLCPLLLQEFINAPPIFLTEIKFEANTRSSL